jgi:hypothetical protein
VRSGCKAAPLPQAASPFPGFDVSQRGGEHLAAERSSPPTITEPTSDLTVFVRAGARGACGPDPRGARPDSRGTQNVQLHDCVGRCSVGRVGGVA